MLKIWDLKRRADESKNSGGPSPAKIRIQKDLSQLELPPGMTIDFEDVDNLSHFFLYYQPTSGLYKHGHFIFTFDIGENYPIDPPKVRLNQKIYHPNIDLNGAICLNILREDWKPVLSLTHIAIGIQFLFLEPNPNDPLNKDAALSFQRDPNYFAYEVHESMQGKVVGGIKFDYVYL